MRLRVSCAAELMCGKKKQFASAYSGWLGGSGLGSVTSNAAYEIHLSDRARTSASVSTTGPRA